MPNLEEILTDSGRATADMAVDVISRQPELFGQAYRLCMKQEGKMALRAARVVWLVAEKMPEHFQPYFSDMVRKLGDLEHSSVKRCMLKTLTIYDLGEDEELHGMIIDASFKRMNDFGEEVAIRAYALFVLERMVKIYPEIAGELIAALHIMADNSPDTLKRVAEKAVRRLYRSAVP